LTKRIKLIILSIQESFIFVWPNCPEADQPADQLNIPGQVFALRGRLKREAGVNPARSRHCKGDALQKICHWQQLPGRPEDADDPKSGDLPALVHHLTYEG